MPQSQRVAIKRVEASSAAHKKSQPAQKQGSSTKKEKKKKHAFAPENRFPPDDASHYTENAPAKAKEAQYN